MVKVGVKNKECKLKNKLWQSNKVHLEDYTSDYTAPVLLGYCMGDPLSSLFGLTSWHFFQNQVAKRREGLLNYMFLRLTPTLPNTFINLASPIVDRKIIIPQLLQKPFRPFLARGNGK
ncbi:SNARE associated Golgi protein family [Prunus dulcis]|uniref:SNARE associated Golgi protein family n=1 Tax=Prunus dulcis TaxID=3755 RepID=A0A4Y1R6Y3_PRUDU|nr:SNARE associated Golgi protein family [Prunus dulcis]